MPPPTPPPLVLLAKLAAAAAAAAAAVLLAFRSACREEAVSSLRRDVRDAAAALAAGDGDGDPAPPPAVLVAGFRGNGTSSLVNTACRALAGEAGPLLLRAEAAPRGGGPEGRRRLRVPAVVAGSEGDVVVEDAVVDLVEAAPLPDAARLTRDDVEAAITGGAGAGAGGMPAVECVVLVLRCDAPTKERGAVLRRLPLIASVVRDKGLNLIVVLTNKKAMRSLRQAEELLREVSFGARTDCVYFIENYTWKNNGPNLHHPPIIKNDFETHFTVLTIIRQCLEFVKLYRSCSEQKVNNNEKSISKVPNTDAH